MGGKSGGKRGGAKGGAKDGKSERIAPGAPGRNTRGSGARGIRPGRRSGRQGLLCAASLALLLAGATAEASLVAQTSLGQMWAGSALVFEGWVIEVWPVRDPQSGGIDTWLRFEVQSVLKGQWVEKTLALRFMGGEMDGVRDEVAGLRLPAMGEHGIYFVETLSHFQVNPLFGWDQGRLRIVRDGRGVERVVSAAGDPILGVGEALRAPGGVRSRGVADGLRADAAARLEDAILPREFARELRRQLGGVRP